MAATTGHRDEAASLKEKKRFPYRGPPNVERFHQVALGRQGRTHLQRARNDSILDRQQAIPAAGKAVICLIVEGRKREVRVMAVCYVRSDWMTAKITSLCDFFGYDVQLWQRRMVPGGGIEPPTRGFSVHCSTPELPGHGWGQAGIRAF